MIFLSGCQHGQPFDLRAAYRNGGVAGEMKFSKKAIKVVLAKRSFSNRCLYAFFAGWFGANGALIAVSFLELWLGPDWKAKTGKGSPYENLETNLRFKSLAQRTSTKEFIIHHPKGDSAQTVHQWHLNNAGLDWVPLRMRAKSKGRPERNRCACGRSK